METLKCKLSDVNPAVTTLALSPSSLRRHGCKEVIGDGGLESLLPTGFRSFDRLVQFFKKSAQIQVVRLRGNGQRISCLVTEIQVVPSHHLQSLRVKPHNISQQCARTDNRQDDFFPFELTEPE